MDSVNLYLSHAENGQIKGIAQILAERLDRFCFALEKIELRLQALEQTSVKNSKMLVKQLKAQQNTMMDTNTELTMIKFYAAEEHKAKQTKRDRNNRVKAVFSSSARKKSKK